MARTLVAGLLSAFAAEGFRLLRDHLATAVAAARDAGMVDCIQIGLSYVEFAVQYPAHFAVMFRPEHLHVDDDAYRRAGMEALAVLLDAVATIRDDLPPDDAQIMSAATGAWSMAHGFAMLWLEGPMSELTASREPTDAAAAAFSAFGAMVLRASAPSEEPRLRLRRRSAP